MHQLGNSNTCKRARKSNPLVRVSTNVYLLTHSHSLTRTPCRQKLCARNLFNASKAKKFFFHLHFFHFTSCMHLHANIGNRMCITNFLISIFLTTNRRHISYTTEMLTHTSNTSNLVCFVPCIVNIPLSNRIRYTQLIFF